MFSSEQMLSTSMDMLHVPRGRYTGPMGKQKSFRLNNKPAGLTVENECQSSYRVKNKSFKLNKLLSVLKKWPLCPYSCDKILQNQN